LGSNPGERQVWPVKSSGGRGKVAVAAHHVKTEDVPAFDEKRPFLLIVGFEGGEVDN